MGDCISTLALAYATQNSNIPQQWTTDASGRRVLSPEYRAWGEAQLFSAINQLDRVTYAGPGVLLCKGAGAVYNPAPPLNPDWLMGRLAAYEFSAIVDRVNRAALEVVLTLPPVCRPEDIPYRHSLVMVESARACAAISAEWAGRGICVTVDNGQHETTITAVTGGGEWSVNTTTRHVNHCSLYLTIR